MDFYTLVVVHGNKIVDIGYNKNGKKIIKKSNFQPTIGYENNEESDYKNIYGNNLKVKKFKNINEGRDYIKENKDLIPIYGNIPAEYQYIQKNYKKINFNYKHLKIFFYDIEVISEVIDWNRKIKIRKKNE